ncbi:hypothetical protein WJX72_003704 [[Myrmecia] bisecta]|uniref:Uncharacterized protein n=1 Tax=[Myrmecia] bisecta TaxID=41462 RepID=A0AAW1P789_9CHLO
MQEFYHHKAIEGVRPHVFGMTASPVNMKATQSASNVQSVFATLESNLDAKVLTVSNRDEMEAIAPSPDVLVREYPPPAPNATIARAVAVQSLLQQNKVMKFQVRVKDDGLEEKSELLTD